MRYFWALDTILPVSLNRDDGETDPNLSAHALVHIVCPHHPALAPASHQEQQIHSDRDNVAIHAEKVRASERS